MDLGFQKLMIVWPGAREAFQGASKIGYFETLRWAALESERLNGSARVR
jgi:hypothetical protein